MTRPFTAADSATLVATAKARPVREPEVWRRLKVQRQRTV